MQSQIIVDFEGDVLESCTSAQTTFRDLSKSSEGAIVEWIWDLGGVNASLESPGRIFTEQGGYDICLTVKDVNGNTASLCKENYINIYGTPIADFTAANAIGCAPLTVHFEDLSSSPNGEIQQWTWGLGGSNDIITTQSENKSIFSIYGQADIYTVSLSIVDEKGCETSVTKDNIIEAIASPTIDVESLEPIGCSFPMTVDFENYGESENIEYQWFFGNGDSYKGYNPEPISYATEGSYDVTIVAKNLISNCSDTLKLSDYVNTGGTIKFDFYPKQGCRNVSVQFEDTSPIEAETWEWDFGDGVKSTDRDPAHVYKLPGEYTISLQRKTAECSGVQVSEYKVEVLENPILEFQIDNDNSCLLPANVEFKAKGDPNYKYVWYVGSPGAYETILTDQEAEFDFETFGDRQVRLFVYNEIGCRSAKLIDTIKIEPFKARIIGESEGCIPFTSELDVISKNNSPITNVEWSVYGKDSINSSEKHFTLLIDRIDNYYVEAIVTNEIGCIDTIQEANLLKGGVRPDIDFAISDTIFCPRETITLEDLSSNNANSWLWTIGDSTFLEDQNPDFVINNPGNFDVSLLVGHNGCFAHKEIDELFSINPPGGSFDLVYNCDDPYSVKARSSSSQYDSLVWEYSIGNDTIIVPFEDSIIIQYPDKNLYTINLKAFNYEFGCEAEETDTVRISDPKAAFTLTTDQGCIPLTVGFQDASEDAVSWKYFTEIARFNDDTLASPAIRIGNPGEYTEMGQIITDVYGCKDTAYVISIKVNAADALFSPPDPVCLGDTMTVNNASTSFFSNIIKNTWTIGGDLDTLHDVNAIFSFNEIGKHDVKLVVEDGWGCKDSITTGLSAYFRGPNFELIADSLSCTTHALDFRNKFHALTYNYQWDFGDGATSTEINPLHLYTEEGNYPLSVRIEDDESCVNEVDLVQIIQVADPIASFSADSTFAPCPPLITTFENTSINGVSYEWSFGDNSGQSSELAPAHLYTIAGVFDVGLIVERTPFCRDTFNIEELVHLDGPRGEFSFEVDSSCVPLTVSFEAILAEEYTLTWDFGDGNLLPIEEKIDYSKVSYDYLLPGDFIPKIILEDNVNCKISRAGENIQTDLLEANFRTLDSIYCNAIPSSIIFNDLSQTTSPLISHSWGIGQGNTNLLSGANPEYFTSDTGRYDVTLTVTNAFCSDTLTKSNYLRIGDNPTLSAVTDTFNCVNTTIDLLAITNDQDDLVNWWSSDGALIDENTRNITREQNASDYIIVEAGNEYNCFVRDTIYVEVIDDKTLFAGPDKTICLGNTTTLDITYGNEIKWENSDNIMCDTCKSISLSPTQASFYPVELVNDFGCRIVDTLFIDVLTQEDIDAGDDQQVCFSDKAILLAYAQGTLEWGPSHLLESTDSYITAANIQESTMFYLSSTVDECTLRDSIYVEIVQKADLEVMGDTVCFGDDGQLSAFGLVDHVTWESDEEDVSNMQIMNPTTSNRSTKIFMAIGNLGQCAPDTAYAEVMVYPEIKGHLPEVRNYFKGVEEIEVKLNMESQGDYDFLWSPKDMVSCQNCEQVMVKIQDTSHTVAVEIIERESGCRDTMSVEIRQYYGCESATTGIGVPNVFSPNDDGVNDYLNIEAPAFGDITSLSIFDRWGQKVFQAKSIEEEWDGKLNGNPVQPGVYSFIISANCPDSNTDVFTAGDITVIR